MRYVFVRGQSRYRQFSLGIQPLQHGKLRSGDAPFRDAGLMLHPSLQPADRNRQFHGDIRCRIFVFRIHFDCLQLATIALTQATCAICLRISSHDATRRKASNRYRPEQQKGPSHFCRMALHIRTTDLRQVCRRLRHPPARAIRCSWMPDRPQGP